MIGHWRERFFALPFTQQGALVATLAFLLDQGSKIAVIFLLPQGARVNITPFMDFVHIRNTGVSYGLLGNLGAVGRWGLVLIALALVLLCVRWLQNAKTPLYAAGLGLIIGGGLGNLWDRIFYGNVVDFIFFYAFELRWYVFNIADLCLTFGIIMFFTAEWKRDKTK